MQAEEILIARLNRGLPHQSANLRGRSMVDLADAGVEAAAFRNQRRIFEAGDSRGDGGRRDRANEMAQSADYRSITRNDTLSFRDATV